MSLRLKFNLILGLATLLGITVAAVFAYYYLQKNARQEVLDDARIMLESALAVRDYTISEIRPLLALQQKRQFLPQTIPAYSARKYINKLQVKYPQFTYKEATLNPTNLVSRATGWEVDVVEWFRNNPKEKELIGERDSETGRIFYLAHPLQIKKEACLACHSTPSAAPATMIEAYGNANGFGWKMNEIVGVQLVSVPMSLPLTRANSAFKILMAALIGVFLLVGLILNILLYTTIIKPVKFMAENANRVSMGALDAPELEFKGKDEITSLAHSFNRMHRSLANAVKMIDDYEAAVDTD